MEMDIKQIFSKMNQKLQNINKKVELDQCELSEIEPEIENLKNQSEFIVDEWLKFEENLGEFLKKCKGKNTEPHELITSSISTEDYEAQYQELLKPDQNEEPEYESERWKKGKALFDLEMYEQAISYLHPLVVHEPEFNWGSFYLAHAYIHTKQYDQARYHFQFLQDTSGDENIKNLSIHALACLEAMVGDLDRALFLFNKMNMKALDATLKPVALFNKAQTLFQLKRYDECLDVLINYYEHEPTDWKGPYLIGTVYHRMGNEEAGFAFWFEALQLQQNKELLKKMASFFEEKTYYQMAAQCYERCLKEDRQSLDEEIWFGLAWNYGLSNQKEKCRGIYMKALSLFPNHLQLQFSYIWMLLLWKQEKEASKLLNKLKQKYPHHPMMKGLEALKRGEVDEAIEILNQDVSIS